MVLVLENDSKFRCGNCPTRSSAQTTPHLVRSCGFSFWRKWSNRKKNTVLRQVETIIKKNRSCSTQLFCWGSFWGLSLATAICWLDLAIQTCYVVHNTNSASFSIPTPCFSGFFKKLKTSPRLTTVDIPYSSLGWSGKESWCGNPDTSVSMTKKTNLWNTLNIFEFD